MQRPALVEADSATAPSLPVAPFLLLVGLVLLLHLAAGLGAEGFHTTGRLPDTDSWLRVGRVLDLRQGAGWFDSTVVRLNAPAGLSLHWTRPLDVMILLPALALEGALGLAPRAAVLLAGAWICPVLHAGCAAAAFWAARALWTGIGPLLAGLLVAANPAANGYSVVGRADHHTLILLAGLLALGFAARAAAQPAERGAAWRAGLSVGLGVWVSPEALFFAGPVLAGFGAVWVAEGRPGFPGGGAAAQGLRASLGFTLAVAAGVAIEFRPSGWLGGDYDKVSAQHVLMGALAAAVFAAAARTGGGAVRRAATGGALAAAAMATLLFFRPHALQASLGGMDEGSATHFAPMNAEMQPVDLSLAGLFGEAPMVLAAAPAAILTLVLAVPGWRRDGRVAAAVPLALALAMALPATLLHRRFGVDLAAPASLLAAGLPGLALGLRRPGARAACALLAMAGLFATPLLGLLAPASAERKARVSAEQCGTAAVADAVERGPSGSPSGEDDPVLFASSINVGPELVWRAPLRLVGAPYHRGGEAFVDTKAFFSATDDGAARAVAARREASFVLLCAPRPGERVPDASLIGRLRRGEAPGWLLPVAVPGAPEGVRLFAVRRPAPAGPGAALSGG